MTSCTDCHRHGNGKSFSWTKSREHLRRTPNPLMDQINDYETGQMAADLGANISTPKSKSDPRQS